MNGKEKESWVPGSLVVSSWPMPCDQLSHFPMAILSTPQWAISLELYTPIDPFFLTIWWILGKIPFMCFVPTVMKVLHNGCTMQMVKWHLLQSHGEKGEKDHILMTEQIVGALQWLWGTVNTTIGIVCVNIQKLRKLKCFLQDAEGKVGRGHQNLVCSETELSDTYNHEPWRGVRLACRKGSAPPTSNSS